MSDNFVNLHVHTAQGSLLDSILTVKELVNFAKENGQKAIAVTEENAMTGSNKNYGIFGRIMLSEVPVAANLIYIL